MRFDGAVDWDMITAKMRFSHLSLSVHRAWPGGSAWLACFCIFLAGNVLGDPIEIVPARGSTISTNINQREPATRKDFDAIVPRPADPFNPDESWQGITPNMMPPPVNRTLSPHEKELLDRRRNWVFMTPEELLSGENSEEMLGIKQYDKDGSEKHPTTVMERYYERLIEPNRNMVTNQFDKDSDSWSTATNTIVDGEQNRNSEHPFESPFNSGPEREVFQPLRPNSLSDVFGTSPDSTASDAETIKAEKEQKAHMESFKQLWEIDQPSAPAAASISGSSSSGSEASSFPSMQPVLGTVSSSVSSSSAQASGTSTQQAPAPLHAPPPPPRPNFTLPQRPF